VFNMDVPDQKTITLNELSLDQFIAGTVSLTIGFVVAYMGLGIQQPVTLWGWLGTLGGWLCFGVLWVVPTVWLACGRHEVVLTRSSATVTVRSGLFVFFGSRTYRADQLDAVAVIPSFERPKRVEIWGYDHLISVDPGVKDRGDTIQFAEEVASYLPLPIWDASKNPPRGW
jgi:hypothetical protein